MKRAILATILSIAIAGVVYYQWRRWQVVNTNNQAVQHMNAGEHAQAIEILQQLHQQRPKDRMVLNNLAECYKNNRQFKEAIGSYEKMLALNPQHQTASKMIAECNAMIARPIPTPVATPASPSKLDFVALINLQKKALSLMKEGDHKQAASLLRKAHYQKPESEWILVSLGRCYMEAEQYSSAIKTYEKLLRLNSNHPEAKQRLKTCQEKLGSQPAPNGKTAEGKKSANPSKNSDEKNARQAKKLSPEEIREKLAQKRAREQQTLEQKTKSDP